MTTVKRCKLISKDYDYNELISTTKAYYEMYAEAETYVNALMSRNRSNPKFIPPIAEELEKILKKNVYNLSFLKKMFYTSICDFIKKNIGKQAMITANPNVQCSLQIPKKYFKITRENNKTLLNIEGFKSTYELIDLTMKPSDITFIIIHPIVGKTGALDLSKWQVKLYTGNQVGFMLNHTDTSKNPRYAGII